MDVRGSCPISAQLRDLLAGDPSEGEQAELARHLDSCEHCQRVLDGLLVGEGSWVAAARDLSETEEETAPLLRAVVDRLKAPAGASVPAGEDTAIDFLEPSEDPGHLGRFGPFEVLEVLGRGGMGVVLKAIDAELGRVAAVKVLAPSLAASPSSRRRFEREARAASAVDHEHIVPIRRVGEASGLPFLEMPYVAGESLRERIEREGPLPLADVLRIGAEAASALAAAHARGIVHRDVKPANILLEKGTGRARLTDFGLARVAGDVAVTASGVIAGTPRYMSPEQARGEAVDLRSDLFSLGGVLYAMAAGRPPFDAGSPLAVLRLVCEAEPLPLRRVNREVPPWLGDLIARLMAKDPADRPGSAAEVADVLARGPAHVRRPSLVPRPRRSRPRSGRRRSVGRTAFISAGLAMPVLVLAVIGADRLPLVVRAVAGALGLPAPVEVYGYWRFEGDYADSGTHGRHARPSTDSPADPDLPDGMKTVRPGPFLADTALEAPGSRSLRIPSGAYVEVPGDPGPDRDFTVECFFRSRSSGTIRTLVGTRDHTWTDGDGDGGWNISLAPDGVVVFNDFATEVPNGPRTQAKIRSATSCDDGGWHHVAATVGPDDAMELFVDGVSQGRAEGCPSWTVRDHLRFGHSHFNALGSSFPFDGRIDEVRISRGVLTPGQFLRRAGAGRRR